MIKKFSPEVISQLKYYVYRLIDPRNGQTFYVGKGTGNRIFKHVQCTIDYYDGDKEKSDDDPNKFRIIKDILDEGLEVIHVIQRWNLTEEEAYLVESVLMEAFQGLSNLQKGHHSEFGVTNADVLEKTLLKDIYDEPKDFKYLIIKVRQWNLDEQLKKFPKTYRYEATRWCWKIRPRSIKAYPYVFSVTDGIVKEVYKIDKWVKVPNSERFAFEGMVAEEGIRNKYIDKRIPEKYCKRGMASPVLFSKN